MKINKLLNFIAILFFLVSFKVFAEEVEFQASNIEVKNDGNIILAYETKTNIPDKSVVIESEEAEYNKKNQIIIFKKNVYFQDLKNNLIIKGDKITYEKSKDKIYSEGNTFFNIENNYNVKSSNVFYERKKKIIFSNEETKIKDIQNNLYKFKDKFAFDIKNKIIKSNNSEILDANYNKYIFEDLIINTETNEIIGKELKVEFEDSYFGNKKNDPVLKGRSGYSNDEELKIYKAVFSTCNTKKKNCRGWELNTNEFNHDKIKKIFEYKDSWLKLFDFKFLYLPYFNHPDPTVKRRSGFLTPSYSSSDTLGTSINIPYFKIIDIDKDITFTPRYYADKSFLLQNEYRQALENSDILSEFSFLVGDHGTKSHIFFNQIGEFNSKTKYELNLQDVNGDNYLKTHNLDKSSKLISNDNLLLSNFDIDWSFSSSELNTSFKIFEDLSKNYHDRYQYVFPEFSFRKNINTPQNYNGNFSFSSYGYNKNYNTNVIESVLTNDFLFKSNDYINKSGLVSNYNLLLKNSSSYSNNSSNFEENADYNLFGILKVDTSLPLQKKLLNHTHLLKPIASARYSPNGNSDISSKDVMLNFDNVFNLNRIGTTYEVEGGESLSLGLEFQRKNNTKNNLINFKVANVIKPESNPNLPNKSKLNQTRSDIFGNLKFKFDENFKLGYFFSYDENLEYTNLEGLNLQLGVNNFVTKFNYYSQNNDLADKESIQNTSKYKLDDENSFSFNLRKDLKENYTQYYDFVYEYLTDCLSVNINYSKSFYSDGNLEPNKSLSFLVKIIPFTEIGVPNAASIVGR